MLQRPSSWWRVLGAVIVGLAPWFAVLGAGASTPTPVTVSVTHQDATTNLSARGVARFHLGLGFSSPLTGSLALALYPHAVTLSGLQPILSGAGDTARPVSATGVVNVDCHLKSATFLVSLVTGRAQHTSEPCGARTLNLRLPCTGAACDGVYPLRISTVSAGVNHVEWSLIALKASRVTRPLKLVWISKVGPGAWHHRRRTTSDLTVLAHQNEPMNLGLDYRTLNDALNDTGDSATAWRSALSGALTDPLHRALAAPPPTIDFGGLATNGLSTQVALQLNLTNNLLTDTTGRFVDPPVALSGTPSLASLKALSDSGVRDVVVPEDALTVPPSSTLAWGAPFSVAGTQLTVLATDRPLAQLATDVAIEPGRRAALLLAVMAFLHFEAPNAPATRTIVLDTPLAETSPTFLAQFFNGLAHDPFTHAASLTPAFDATLVGTNGAPSDRVLSTSVDSAWSAHNVTSLQYLIGTLNSYADAVASKDVAQSLRVAMAATEIVGTPTQRQSQLNQVTTNLARRLDQFSVATSAITLAGPGTALPITLLSHADYPVTVAVHLVATGLGFPSGSVVSTTLKGSVTSLRVPITSHGASSATLQVVVTTPNDQVELARAAIQVRVAGASVVGYLLTAASLVVLGVWWWRTVRRRRRGRHAR